MVPEDSLSTKSLHQFYSEEEADDDRIDFTEELTPDMLLDIASEPLDDLSINEEELGLMYKNNEAI